MDDKYPYFPGFAPTDTSFEAADDMHPKSEDWRSMVLSEIKQSGGIGLTVHETAARLEAPVATIQPRFSELRLIGKIEDAGRRRLNSSTNKRAIVWVVADA